MAINYKSCTKDVLACEEACDILEEYLPGFTTDSRMKVAYPLPLKLVLANPQCGLTRQQQKEIEERINAIES